MKNFSIASGLFVGLALAFLMVSQPASAADPTIAWAQRYHGPGNGSDGATALKVDSSGNVYVSGSSLGSGTGYDLTTIKYGPNGNELWVKRFNASADGDATAAALAVDRQGNIYVTGSAEVAGTKKDYATIKYNKTNGDVIWAKRYNGPGNGDDTPKAIAVDDLGNVYVTGTSIRSEPFVDIATIKYDSNGNELWVKRYNDDSALLPNGWGHAIAVDSSGNVYVAGGASGPPSEGIRYATIKYSSTGSQLWAKIYSGSDSENGPATAIAVDAYGNVYVTGDSVGFDYDYATVKYSPTGTQLWVARYNGPGNYGDQAFAIAVDALGYVYVTGVSDGLGGNSESGNTFWDYATVKYSPGGTQLWASRYDGPANKMDSPAVWGGALALDNQGNVYVTGASSAIVGASTIFDYATIKYNSAGAQVWAKRYRSPASLNSSANAVAVDNKGNVYVTGASADSPTTGSFATIKYSQGPQGRLWGWVELLLLQ